MRTNTSLLDKGIVHNLHFVTRTYFPPEMTRSESIPTITYSQRYAEPHIKNHTKK